MKMNELKQLLRPFLDQFTPYSSARDEFSGQGSIYLDANENPFNTAYNRYPESKHESLKRAVGSYLNVPPEQLIFGNGSDEIIDLLYRATCQPGLHKAVQVAPTYGMYAVSAAINQVEMVTLRANADFEPPWEALAQLDSSCRIAFFCSPNNPSGNLINTENLLTFARKFSGWVVVDEAYVDFAGNEFSLIQHVETIPNLCVMRTFSKAFGLAGIRLGYLYGNKILIEALSKIKPPYNININTLTVSETALNEVASLREQIGKLIKSREWLVQQLTTMPAVKKVFPSQANFVLVQVTNAPALYQWLLEQGIVVRLRHGVAGCDQCLRITVGTRAECEALIKALQAYSNL